MKRRFCLIPVLALALTLGLSGCAGSTDGLYTKGAKALEEGEYQEAIDYFEEGIDSGSRLAENYRGIGIASYESGDYDTAVDMLNKSLEALEEENDDFIIDLYYYLGDAYMAKGEIVRAGEAYTSLLDYTHSARAYEKRGIVYMEKGDTDRGIKDFEKSLELDDSYAATWEIYSLCKNYGQESKGEAYIQSALSKESSDKTEPEDYYYRGLFNYTLGYYDQAKEELLTAADEDLSEAELLLGKVYLAMDDTASATSLYEDYLSKDENAYEAYNGLALCCMAAENYDGALSYIEQGLSCETDEDMQDLLYNRIVAYEYKLEFDQAKSYMEEYLEAYPDDEDALREYQFLKSR